MKKLNKNKILFILLAFIVLMLTWTNNVKAESILKMNLTTSKTEIKPGDTIVITLSTTEISGVDGITFITGKINYDKSIFETIDDDDFTNQGSWILQILNSNTGKFSTMGRRLVNKTSNVFKLEMRVKNDAKIGTTRVSISNITASGVTGSKTADVSAKDVGVTLKAASTPTAAPTQNPTQAPTPVPTMAPTQNPTQVPTRVSTQNPIQNPTQAPTERITNTPTINPTSITIQVEDKPITSITNIQEKIQTQAPTETEREDNENINQEEQFINETEEVTVQPEENNENQNIASVTLKNQITNGDTSIKENQKNENNIWKILKIIIITLAIIGVAVLWTVVYIGYKKKNQEKSE